MSISTKGIIAIEQINHDTTSWIGRSDNDKVEVSCGQTFTAPADLNLEAVQVFSGVVMRPGKLVLTLHQFDDQQRQWGPALATTGIELTSSNSEHWVSFKIPGQKLAKGKQYGFRISCADAYIGLGETAGSHAKQPFDNGQEWQFSSDKQQGNAFSYFSLAFKLDVKPAA